MKQTEQFQWLFVTEYPTVVRTIYLMLHDHAVAEEIAQDAFVQLLRSWDKVRRYDSPGAWVRRVAIRMAVRHARREGRRRLLTPTVADRAAVTPPAYDGVADELLTAIKQLSPRQRTVVVLFYYEDRPMDEIADIVGCSVSSGWVHLHRARKRLGLLLDEEVGSDVG